MNDNDDTSTPENENVINFRDLKDLKNRKSTTEFPSNKDSTKKLEPTTDVNGERQLIIDLADGSSVSMSGYIGLTSSFLAIGDGKGQIKFAVNGPFWTAVVDVTDDEHEAIDPDVA